MSSNANSASGASIKSPPRGIDRVLLVFEYAYLIRFPILSGFLLAIALPFSFYLLPSFAVGLFDARGIWSPAVHCLDSYESILGNHGH